MKTRFALTIASFALAAGIASAAQAQQNAFSALNQPPAAVGVSSDATAEGVPVAVLAHFYGYSSNDNQFQMMMREMRRQMEQMFRQWMYMHTHRYQRHEWSGRPSPYAGVDRYYQQRRRPMPEYGYGRQYIPRGHHYGHMGPPRRHYGERHQYHHGHMDGPPRRHRFTMQAPPVYGERRQRRQNCFSQWNGRDNYWDCRR